MNKKKAVERTAKIKEKREEFASKHIPLKKYAKGGKISTLMALINVLVIALCIVLSILQKGNAGIYIGIIMLAVLISGAVGFVLGINSFKEENKFLTYSYVGTIANAAIWISILGLYLIYV